MESLTWIAAGLFLPLFPMTMVFNALFQGLANKWLRVLLLLLWPLPGIYLLTVITGEVATNGIPVAKIPDWVMTWALFTAALYGFRGIVVRELGIWSGYIATSAWSLIWITHAIDFSDLFSAFSVSSAVQASAGAAGVAMVSTFEMQTMIMQAMAFSLPLVCMVLLISELEKRYESAYAGIVSGLAQAQPNLSGVLVIFTMAVIGSPIFPSFFFMVHNTTAFIREQPMLSLGMAVVWLMWSWSAIRLLQDLLVGPACKRSSDGIGEKNVSQKDLSKGVIIMYSTLIVILAVAGIYVAGRLL